MKHKFLCSLVLPFCLIVLCACYTPKSFTKRIDDYKNTTWTTKDNCDIFLNLTVANDGLMSSVVIIDNKTTTYDCFVYLNYIVFAMPEDENRYFSVKYNFVIYGKVIKCATQSNIFEFYPNLKNDFSFKLYKN